MSFLHSRTSSFFPVLPLFLGQIALIFQNPLFFTSFFRNFVLGKH